MLTLEREIGEVLVFTFHDTSGEQVEVALCVADATQSRARLSIIGDKTRVDVERREVWQERIKKATGQRPTGFDVDFHTLEQAIAKRREARAQRMSDGKRGRRGFNR